MLPTISPPKEKEPCRIVEIVEQKGTDLVAGLALANGGSTITLGARERSQRRSHLLSANQQERMNNGVSLGRTLLALVTLP
jgi:hypothetical protein